MTDDLQTRAFEVRLSDEEAREVSGIAVPWDDEINVGGIRERFERGAVKPSENVLLLYGHSEPIGRITAHRDTDKGHEIDAVISKTARGDEVYTLLRDGVLTKFSVGFRPVEDREEDGVIIREAVDLREVSVVPFPAYQGASITDVRSDSAANPPKTERSEMTDVINAAEVEEIRGSIEELSREVRSLATPKDETPAADMRSAGEIVKALASGDEATIRHYEEIQKRAYTGGTTANAPVKDGWVGNLTRIFDASSGVLSQIFGSGTLPAEGLNVEFAELATNTMTVEEQVAEGDDLKTGQVTLTTRTAPVKTYGGATELTRQAIERSSLPVLSTSLEALSQAAGVRKKLELRTAFNALVAARIVAEDVIDIAATPSAYDWADAVVDAAINLEAKGAGIDALVVSTDVFKSLIRLETDGRRVFRIDGAERTMGELDLTGLVGDIAGVKVIADTAASAGSAAFVNGRALKQYDSAVVSLQDENIINLSKSFSVYRYGAVAAEIPGFVVPVVFDTGE